jgi:Ala-tRNA(Pro) deacylase
VNWDDDLMENDIIYMEAGDHRHLISIKQSEFFKLMQNTLHERFSANRNRHYQTPLYIRHTYDSL